MPALQPNAPSLVESLVNRAESTQRIVLVGGGHAHVQVIKALNRQSRPAKMDVTLIDVQRSASYSGMVPGTIAKLYTVEETQLHLKPLAAWSGIKFINDKVVDVDFEQRTILLENTLQPIPFDVVSLDIGSASRGLYETPGAKENAIPTRPVSELIRRVQEDEERRLSQSEEDTKVVVIGGGAAGIELSLAIRGRWKNLPGKVSVTVLDAGNELLPNESFACQMALKRIMKDRNIEVRHQCLVDQVTASDIVLVSGEHIRYTHCLWATGAGAHRVARQLKKRGLAVTKSGWIRVNENLQSLSHPFVFAAGDCASIEGGLNSPPPKAGVYAVRAGPVLIDNLTNYFKNQPLTVYEPQDDFLKLMACGDGTALGFRFGIPLYGKWVWQLKDSIDQKFMFLFKLENLPSLRDGAPYDTAQYDAGFVKDDTEQLSPEFAAQLLGRTDDKVDYLQAWKVLRDMTQDKMYRTSVLQRMDMLERQRSWNTGPLAINA